MASSGFTPYSHRDFIKQLRQLLQDRYTWDGDGFSILKELIQNANDAGATRLDLGWVPATENPAHPLLGSAALFAVNDGPFHPSDARNITRLGSNSKAGEATTAGRFGLGLKSVFHLCEAFFYLASPAQSDQESVCRIFNPWSPQPNDEPSPYEHWDFDSGDSSAVQIEKVIRGRLGQVLPMSSQFFCLWIPLRDTRLLEGNPSIVPGTFDETRLHSMIGHDSLGCRLAELMPYLHSLKTICIWSPRDQDVVEHLRVQLADDSHVMPKLPEADGAQFPNPRKSNLNGTIVLHQSTLSEVRCDYSGNETIPQNKSLQKLWNHPAWPKDESLDPETNNWREHRAKMVPHGAVRFMATPATGRTPRLSLHWCVFLPLGSDKSEEHIEIGTMLTSDVSIFLHGYFFVDSGRKRHIKTDFQAEKMQSLDVEHLQQEWNSEIEANAVWPFLLESLKEFVARLAWNDRQIQQLTKSLRDLLKTLGEDVIECVASKKKWVYVLTPSSEMQNTGEWQLKSANSSISEIPRPPAAVNVYELLPGLANANSKHFITIAGFPSISSKEPSGWSPGRLKQLIQSTNIDLAFANIDNLGYLADLVEHCSTTEEHDQAVGKALWPLLKQAFNSPDRGFTMLRDFKEPLLQLLGYVPAEHRLNLPWATDEHDNAAEVFHIISATKSNLLPIPSFLKPSGQDCRVIDSQIVINILEQIVELSLGKSLLAEVVGDLLNRADLDRDSFSTRLSDLKLIIVSNLQTGSFQRATWKQIQQQKQRRLLFCDKAGLTKQFQAAIGSAGDVWRIDPDFAKKVLGDKHDIPGCSARECARILSSSRERNLNDIQNGQLGQWDDRRELLESLVAEIGRTSPNDREHLKYACRLLFHGRIGDAEFNPPLFIAAEELSDPLAEKLCYHVLCRRIDPVTHSTEEWRIIDGERADWISKKLNQEQIESLGLVSLRFSEPAVLELLASAKTEQLTGMDVSDEQYGLLLETLSETNPELIKRLPIHVSISGTRVAIESNMYWENGYQLDGELERSAKLLRMHKDTSFRKFQLKLAEPLGAQQIAEIVLQAEAPERHWKPLLKAIARTKDKFPEEILDALRTQRWFVSQYGAHSCNDLICLAIQDGNEPLPEQCISAINRIVDDSGAAYVPDWLLDQQLQKELRRNSGAVARKLFEWELLPDVKMSLQRLGLLLGESSDNFIGYLSSELFRDWLSIEWGAGLMPVHDILKTIAERFGTDLCHIHATEGVRESLESVDRLFQIVQWLAESHGAAGTKVQKEPLFRLFQTYFDFLASHSDFEADSHLRSLKLLSKEGTWRPSTRLCFPPADGISQSHVLDDSLSALFKDRLHVKESSDEHSLTETVVALPSRASINSLRDPVAVVKEYFRSWEGHLPNDVIGGFIALLGGAPEMEERASQFLGKRSLDETRHNLKITSNRIGLRSGKIEEFRVQVDVIDEQVATTTNLLGEQFQAPLDSSVKSLLVGFGDGSHVRTSYSDEFAILKIQVRPVHSILQNSDAEFLTQLLADAAETLLVEGYSHSSKEDTHQLVHRTFQDLLESDQLEIRVTQQLILDDSELLLNQLGLGSDSVFRSLLAELTKHKRLRAERDHNERRFHRKASWTESEFEEEHNTPNQMLRELLENNRDGQHRVLAALRKRIQGHNQYSPAAIPFELFQNADDACEERKQLLAGTIECDTVRYFINNDLLAIQHCGRCVNQVPPGADSRTHKLSDDLRKMLTPWLSSKDAIDSSNVDVQLTGKFGLGFKSVFLVSDRPRILSGRIACEIVGGVFPKYLNADAQLAFSRYSDLLTENARREMTVIELPLVTDAFNDADLLPGVGTVVGRFMNLAHLLVVFSRQLRRIEIHRDDTEQSTSTMWRDVAVPGVVDCFKGTLVPLQEIHDSGIENRNINNKEQRVLLLRCTRHSGGLLLAHDGRRFISMPDDVPTLWVTAPTQHCLETGFVLNSNFSLDPGRAQLGRESPENERIARDIGRELGERLVGLFEHSRQVGWKQFCSDVGFDPAAKEYEMWDSLWELLGSSLAELPTTSDAATLLRQIFWGEDGAALRFYRECPVLPGRLRGRSFQNQLSQLSQVQFSVRGILSSDDGYSMMCINNWPAFKDLLGDGHVISEKVSATVGKLRNSSSSGRRPSYDLTDMLTREIQDQCVNPADAERFGEVLVGDVLQDCERTEEKRLRDLLYELKFENRKGDFLPAAELIVGHQPQGSPSGKRYDERMRASFAPEERILNVKYLATGVSFFEICRERLIARASEMAEWVLRADTEEKRKAARLYLADGELGRAIQTEINLGGGIKGTWLEDLTKSDEFQEMTPTQQGQLVDLIPEQQRQRVIKAIVESREQSTFPTHSNPADALRKIHRWWTGQHDDRFTRDYERRTYPNGGLQHLAGERDDQFRKDWVVLFLLGLTHTMGRTVAEQHRNFLRRCHHEGRIDMIAASERASEKWTGWIDDYLDNRLDDAKFLQWMKQFVGIYQVSRHLDVYINAFESVQMFDRQFSLQEITWISRSPEFQGSGMDAPQLTRVLGIGQCFVLRELVRNGIITNTKAHRHCYVPVKRVRDLMTYLGCPDLNRTSRKWELSQKIHRFLYDHLGKDASQFDLSFDIPFQIIAEDVDLQAELFDTRLSFDDTDDDDLSAFQNETTQD